MKPLSGHITTETQWGIRDFAKMFDVTPRTIRFYEDKGLLTPSRDGGARIFDGKDYQRFEQIMRGKRLGFSLDDIKEVLEVTDGHVTDRVELLRRQKNFRHVISSLKRRREDIANLARDMTEMCDIIDEHIKKSPDDFGDAGGVFDLAKAYEAKFSQTPFIEETADDFQPKSHSPTAMVNN